MSMYRVKARRASLAAVVMMSAAAMAQDPAAEKPVDQPKAEEVFARCLEAMGGQAAVEQFQSASYNVKLPEMMGMESMNVQAMAPNMCRVDGTFSGGDTAHIVINADKMWCKPPFQEEYSIEDNGGEITGIVVMAAPQYFLHTTDSFKKHEVSGPVDFGGKACRKVMLGESDSGCAGFAVYFDEATGLCAGFDMPSQGGLAMPLIVDEWRDERGFKFISKVHMDMSAMGGENMVLEFIDFKFNEVDAKAFEMPEPVKTLLAERDKPKDTGGGGGGGGTSGSATGGGGGGGN